MSELLLATLLGGLAGFVLLLVGWSRVMSSASSDTDGVGPLTKQDPLRFPEPPHYAQAGREIRAFRKQRRASARRLAWQGSLQSKVQPLASAFPDASGEPLVIAEEPTAEQLDQLLDELERRAGLGPLGSQPTPHIQPTESEPTQ